MGDLGDDKDRLENLKKMYEKTTKWWQDFLRADAVDSPGKWLNIQEVRVTNRLVNTPVALVTSQFGYSAKMEKAYSSQGQDMSMTASKTLEINGDHPAIHQIWMKIKANPEDEGAQDIAVLLTQAAILASGYRLENPMNIVKSVHRLFKNCRGSDFNVPVMEILIPEDLNEPDSETVEENKKWDREHGYPVDDDGAPIEEEEETPADEDE